MKTSNTEVKLMFIYLSEYNFNMYKTFLFFLQLYLHVQNVTF